MPYSVFATRSAWRVLAGTGVGGYRTIGDDLKGDDDEGWRGCPCCAVRTHARRHGDGPAAWTLEFVLVAPGLASVVRHT